MGFQAKRRVLEVQTITLDSTVAEETLHDRRQVLFLRRSLIVVDHLQQLQRPCTVQGQRVSALRLADPTVQALWNAVLMYDLLPAGFPARIWPDGSASPRKVLHLAS